MQGEPPEPPRQALPHYSPDGRWWWDGVTWRTVRQHFWLRGGAMPPSVSVVGLWFSMLFGVNAALTAVGIALWYPRAADSPDDRYLPFLLSAVAVEVIIGIA